MDAAEVAHVRRCEGGAVLLFNPLDDFQVVFGGLQTGARTGLGQGVCHLLKHIPEEVYQAIEEGVVHASEHGGVELAILLGEGLLRLSLDHHRFGKTAQHRHFSL